MFGAIGSLFSLVNKLWDSVAFWKRKKKHEKLIEDIEDGRLASARDRLNSRLREKAARKKPNK